MLMINEHPVEAGQSGNLDGNGRSEVEEGAGEPFAREHPFAESDGSFMEEKNRAQALTVRSADSCSQIFSALSS